MDEINRALSRYDGHSTYVKLETILSVPRSTQFESKPSCYAAELISEVEKRGLSRLAAQNCLKHGISLGFLERIISSGGIYRYESGSRKKIDETARITLSPLGRSLRAADRLALKEFWHFLITCSLLQHDFDMYGLLLKSTNKNKRRIVSFSEFGEQFRSLMHQRQEWLKQNILIRLPRNQVFNHFHRKTNKIKDSSIRHHLNMRREWARYLSHCDDNGFLTDVGDYYARLIKNVETMNSMFWIAPSPECIKKVGGVLQKNNSIFAAWDLLRPDTPEAEPGEEIIRRVAEFMKSAFKTISLRVFAQAPLASIIPYIHFQEMLLNQKVDIQSTFEAVIRRYRETFYCMLTPVPEECYYQLRKHNSVSDS